MDSQSSSAPDSVNVAMAWFLAARAMTAARGVVPETAEAAGGLYAQAILGVSESDCLAAKDMLDVKTLVDCLSTVRLLPRDLAEKVVTGVMMIAYGDATMHPLEVRWASMLASAASITSEDFQRCCAQARVIAAMLRPQVEPAEGVS